MSGKRHTDHILIGIRRWRSYIESVCWSGGMLLFLYDRDVLEVRVHKSNTYAAGVVADGNQIETVQ